LPSAQNTDREKVASEISQTAAIDFEKNELLCGYALVMAVNVSAIKASSTE